MSHDRRRDILERVAARELTPSEAAELLAHAEPDDHPADGARPWAGPLRTETAPGPQAPPAGPASEDDPEVARVRVRGNCRAVSIVGDPDVRTAVAEGAHTARLEGGVLTIESLIEPSHGFAFIRAPGLRSRARVRMGADYVRPLMVRMNPALALDAQVDAGSMAIRSVRGPIRANTSAGAIRVDDLDGPIDLRVAAGSATVRGRLAGGTSRIECDAGKVTVHLTADSNVTIRGRVNLGQLMAPDVIGTGEGVLDVEANLGAIEVAVDDGDVADADDRADHTGQEWLA